MNSDRGPRHDQDDPRHETTPWWADEAPDESHLPDGFPERPDLSRVHELRSRMKQERTARKGSSRGRFFQRFDEKAGKQTRELGTYTLIPTLMLAGPAAGYGLAWLIESRWGGAPYVTVCGILFGLAAAFHQIILLLKKNSGSS